MTSPLIWSLSHPPALLVPCPPPGWVVKLPERLPQERARHTGAVPFCLQEHARPTGVVPDWSLLLGLVAAVVAVVEVVVVPPVVARDEDEDEDEDDEDEDDDALNPLPCCLGPHPDRLDKRHPEDHPLER